MRKGYLGVFLVDGYPELRVDLGAKNKPAVVIKSKVRLNHMHISIFHRVFCHYFPTIL
jgi:hypothetical protein